jgi:hypothetical protein
MDVNTIVSVGEQRQKGIPNITLEDAKFYGRPNFAGEEDRFKDTRRKFTVIVPPEAVDTLRNIGYNVKETVPDADDVEMGRETIFHLKVMVDRGSDVWIIMGDQREKLTEQTLAILDKSRVETLDMEIRGWEYNPEDEAGKYSARLVTLVAVLVPNRLQMKYGGL